MNSLLFSRIPKPECADSLEVLQVNFGGTEEVEIYQ
jgi:hypothetical protein